MAQQVRCPVPCPVLRPPGGRRQLPNFPRDPSEALSFPPPPNFLFVSRGRRSMDEPGGIHSPPSPPPPLWGPPPSLDSFFPFSFHSLGNGAGKGTCHNFKGEEVWVGKEEGPRGPRFERRGIKAGPRFTAKGARPHPAAPRKSRIRGKNINPLVFSAISSEFLPVAEPRCPHTTRAPEHRGFHRTALPCKEGEGKATDFGGKSPVSINPASLRVSLLPRC